jgi:hypothetical protein
VDSSTDSMVTPRIMTPSAPLFAWVRLAGGSRLRVGLG